MLVKNLLTTFWYIVGQNAVAHLSHMISARRVDVDPEKVKAVMDWQIPRNLRELPGIAENLWRIIHKLHNH